MQYKSALGGSPPGLPFTIDNVKESPTLGAGVLDPNAGTRHETRSWSPIPEEA